MCYIEKYINPFTDYGFKKIFGDSENIEEIGRLKKIQDTLYIINDADEFKQFIKKTI